MGDGSGWFGVSGCAWDGGVLLIGPYGMTGGLGVLICAWGCWVVGTGPYIG